MMKDERTPDPLQLDPEKYEIKTCIADGKQITYRAYENLPYCSSPLDPIQRMHIFVPEKYFHGGRIGIYDAESAPVFMPLTIGGYMSGPPMEPGTDRAGKQANSAFEALRHGYVAACPGIRGRDSGLENEGFFIGAEARKANEGSGRMVGRAPALIIDLKAAVRYLRHNKDLIPGSTERIITSGTSAGGVLSALAGATGNAADYEPYLKAIGAAEEKDDIFAASCYCPIHNLENADAAYEWLFGDETEWTRTQFVRKGCSAEKVLIRETMTEKQIMISGLLKERFPGYVNSLGIKDDAGNLLTLQPDGRGAFREYLIQLLTASAQEELETNRYSRQEGLAVPGSDVSEQAFLKISGGRVTGFDLERFVRAVTRMKKAPAFDSLDLDSPECEEFGDTRVYARHFTALSQAFSETESELADDSVIRMINPVRYLEEGSADTAPYWRIRHGAYDRDTSLAIPVILDRILVRRGCCVDFAIPWGVPHCGDYDLAELFGWIDRIVAQN